MNNSNTLLWACPVCQLPLEISGDRWHCANRHSFDIAKSGYANLLLAHQKASKQPGDSADMLHARRMFLEAGYFEPVIDAISACVNGCMDSSATEPYRLLDIGCGEGYYLRQLAPTLNGQWLTAGLDIAKDGVQMAAKRSGHDITWVCASSARLPVMNESLDVLLRVFAPSDPTQTERVLKKHGLLVIVTPAAHHLYEIKSALYNSVKLHQKPVLPEGFTQILEREVSFTLSLTQPDHIQALLRMTPFFWRGHAAGREELMRREKLDVQIAVWIHCYQKVDYKT